MLQLHQQYHLNNVFVQAAVNKNRVLVLFSVFGELPKKTIVFYGVL